MDNKLTSKEKLQILLPHWIEHNHEHGEEFKRWAQELEEEGESLLAKQLITIYNKAEEIEQLLKELLDSAGGALEHSEIHHHDHGHHHHHHHE